MNWSAELLQWWQQQTWYEVIAVITGLACVYLAARNNILNWPFAIISVSIYLYIFFKAHLFADMGLQAYFLAMNIYGWYYWLHKPDDSGLAPVKSITQKQLLISVGSIAACTVILGSGLKYTSASYPYLDSFCAACSVVAQLLMARRVLQNWLLWVFVDVIYVGIYYFKDLHLTAIMYAVYIFMATMGYVEWRREYKKQVHPNG
ncbi:nicotinamide mononucleotide transporter [Mucilaginibacter sp. JRF]|uniref:nicotinamide riboside transporter PnuC n=1 Tax=Mucilaginibacter sp. JRF TaxID=2780088 RepID=UPI00188195AA|nr:nicotinamide riboside transporter PnuC [Mucilaginibacter sp. JRF]MBE9586905.1 nicotinamide mononucleotide transporter [Mucilaginibacter sp. JRF]